MRTLISCYEETPEQDELNWLKAIKSRIPFSRITNEEQDQMWSREEIEVPGYTGNQSRICDVNSVWSAYGMIVQPTTDVLKFRCIFIGKLLVACQFHSSS